MGGDESWFLQLMGSPQAMWGRDRVSHLRFRGLQGLKNLETLDLNQTQVDDLGLQYIGRLKSLKTLSISSHVLSGAGESHLAELHNLEDLYLDGSNLKVLADWRELAKLKSLTSLSLPKSLEGDENIQFLQDKLEETYFSFY
ncbi:MAG: hypothetical protein Aurels2KO_45470 [Aureliella sp.]